MVAAAIKPVQVMEIIIVVLLKKGVKEKDYSELICLGGRFNIVSCYQLMVMPPSSILISMTFLLSVLVEKLIGAIFVSVVFQAHS